MRTIRNVPGNVFPTPNANLHLQDVKRIHLHPLDYQFLMIFQLGDLTEA